MSAARPLALPACFFTLHKAPMQAGNASEWVVSWKCAEVLTYKQPHLPAWPLAAGLSWGETLAMLIEAVLSDSGLQMGKGEGADQTLIGCQPLCQTCDAAHS